MLHRKTVTEENQETTIFLNEEGIITVASDLGYSSRKITKTDKGTIEEYFNPDGDSVMCTSGYYGIYREYDESGNVVEKSYLNAAGKLTMIPYGYAKEKIKYNTARQITEIHFLDTLGIPVCSISEGYIKKYEYNDEGQICKIQYFNENNELMLGGRGYATLFRTFYLTNGPDNGRVMNEFYFDNYEQPISLSLGQYGLHKEYNDAGENTIVVYLNINGEPMSTINGYSTIMRDYQGSSYIEKYFDIEGKPYRMPEGYYGIKQVGGQTIYLDYYGNEIFNIRRLIYNRSRLVIVVVILLISVSIIVGIRGNWLLLIIYCSVIVYFTLLFRNSDLSKPGFGLLRSYKLFGTNKEIRAEIFRNIWLFIPLGTITYRLFNDQKAIFIPVVISLLIEIIQYITQTGWCELDDVISNGLGGVIGYSIGELLWNFIVRGKKMIRIK